MEEIGEKLRAFRLANQMTLKQLATKAGCTSAYLSQLERGLANPSIMILKKIASALNVKVVDFLIEKDEGDDEVFLREGNRPNIHFREGDAQIQLLVRKMRDKRMQPLYTTINPGGGSEGSYSHVGEEFGIVLEGELEVSLNGRPHRLEKGTSFYFSSHTPHSWRNPGKKKTVVLWVVSPPTF